MQSIAQLVSIAKGAGERRQTRRQMDRTLMIPASFLLAANWFFLAIGTTVFVLLAIRTWKEEEHLIATFGDDYRNYMQRTGRFVPRL